MNERYAEGKREPAECRNCGQPVWIVYHGPGANHTVERRVLHARPLVEEPVRRADGWEMADPYEHFRRIADELEVAHVYIADPESKAAQYVETAHAIASAAVAELRAAEARPDQVGALADKPEGEAS